MSNYFISPRFSLIKSEMLATDFEGDYIDIYILRDTNTGINYLLAGNENGIGLTPLLDYYGHVTKT